MIWFDLPGRVSALESQVAALSKQLLQLKGNEMADQETLTRLAADVTANTSAVSAAQQALAGFVSTVANLTAQLQAAIAGDDEAAITAAANALEANNATLTAAIPTVATAVAANTPAASPAAAS